MEYIPKEDYIELKIGNDLGKIDKEDFDLIKEYNWVIHQGYFYTRDLGNLTSMHSLIFGKLSNKSHLIDHINRDKLDNRKNNLRETTRSINSTNAKKRSDKTQLDLPRGVVYRPENPELRKDGKGKKRYESFEVQWSIEGKRHTKTFSVNKYGSKEKARFEAIKFRNTKLEEMKIQSEPIEIQD